MNALRRWSFGLFGLGLMLACSSRDETELDESNGDGDELNEMSSDSDDSDAETGAEQSGSGGKDSPGSGGASELGSGGKDSQGSGGTEGPGSGGTIESGSGGRFAVDPGDPATGSHEGDGTGCSEGQTPDACGLCDGDGSSCDCYEEDLCWEIVFQHNEVRRQLNLGEFADQPVPDPPLAMVGWDPLIAEHAQQWADMMNDWSDGHSSQQFRTYQSTHLNGYHGENMAVGGGQYSEPASFVYDGWCLSEAQNCQLLECGGHYTQVAWRQSVWIGCGQKEDLPFKVDGKSYTGTLTVCQYGPGGNSGPNVY